MLTIIDIRQVSDFLCLHTSHVSVWFGVIKVIILKISVLIRLASPVVTGGNNKSLNEKCGCKWGKHIDLGAAALTKIQQKNLNCHLYTDSSPHHSVKKTSENKVSSIKSQYCHNRHQVGHWQPFRTSVKHNYSTVKTGWFYAEINLWSHSSSHFFTFEALFFNVPLIF